MNKSEYLDKLKHNLRRLPGAELNRAMEYFEEYFADAGPENERQAIDSLGSPEDAAKQLLTNLALSNTRKTSPNIQSGLRSVKIGILAVLALPLGLPLLLTTGALIFMLLFSYFLLILCLYILGVSLVAICPLGIIVSFSVVTRDPGAFLGALGVSAVFGGLGAFVLMGATPLFKWSLRKLTGFFGCVIKKKATEPDASRYPDMAFSSERERPTDGQADSRQGLRPGGGQTDSRPSLRPGGGQADSRQSLRPDGGQADSRQGLRPNGGQADSRQSLRPGGGQADSRPSLRPGGGQADSRQSLRTGGGQGDSRQSLRTGGGQADSRQSLRTDGGQAAAALRLRQRKIRLLCAALIATGVCLYLAGAFQGSIVTGLSVDSEGFHVYTLGGSLEESAPESAYLNIFGGKFR